MLDFCSSSVAIFKRANLSKNCLKTNTIFHKATKPFFGQPPPLFPRIMAVLYKIRRDAPALGGNSAST
jgi:hypothetical protein